MREDIKILFRMSKDYLSIAEFNLEGEKYEAAIHYSRSAVEKSLLAYMLKKRYEKKENFDIKKLVKGFSSNHNITKAYSIIHLALTISQSHEKELKLNEDISKEIMKDAQEIIWWVEKEIEK